MCCVGSQAGMNHKSSLRGRADPSTRCCNSAGTKLINISFTYIFISDFQELFVTNKIAHFMRDLCWTLYHIEAIDLFMYIALVTLHWSEVQNIIINDHAETWPLICNFIHRTLNHYFKSEMKGVKLEIFSERNNNWWWSRSGMKFWAAANILHAATDLPRASFHFTFFVVNKKRRNE